MKIEYEIKMFILERLFNKKIIFTILNFKYKHFQIIKYKNLNFLIKNMKQMR